MFGSGVDGVSVDGSSTANKWALPDTRSAAGNHTRTLIVHHCLGMRSGHGESGSGDDGDFILSKKCLATTGSFDPI